MAGDDPIAGRATGRSAEAEALVERTEALFAATRTAHPEFEGVGLAYAGVYGTDAANYYVETNGSTRMSVLQDLDLVDQDVTLWEPAAPELLPQVQENPLYQSLAVAQEDRDIFMTGQLIAAAIAHSTCSACRWSWSGWCPS